MTRRTDPKATTKLRRSRTSARSDCDVAAKGSDVGPGEAAVSAWDRDLNAAALRWELPTLCLLAWLAFAAIPLAEGGIGLSWDALNHHIYLGWVAQTPRFERDFLAASYQGYQFPYLYWPVYQLAVNGWSGAWAGVALATLHLAAVPPVWMIARTCMVGKTPFDLTMRWLAVAMAFMTGVVLSLFDSTSNDLMAATPLVWALALALVPADTGRPAWLTPRRAALLSGLLAGAAIGCKLSNAPLALVLPVLWLMSANADLKTRLVHTTAACLATVPGYLLVYGYWGSLLWGQFGNPIYPFYDVYFAPVRALTGWTP
ncbi:MAG: hypothetical protein WCH44_02640 [Betaproteobacteria bacterium]